MSAIDYLDTPEQTGWRAPDVFKSATAGDIAASGGTFMALSSGLGYLWDSEEYRKNKSLVEKSFGQNYDQLTNVRPEINERTGAPYGYKEARKKQDEAIDRLIEDARKNKDPRVEGLRTTKEIHEDVTSLFKTQEQDFSNKLARARSTGAMVGGIAGAGLLSVVADPINLASLPFGAGTAMSIKKAVTVEALMNAGIEAAEAATIHKAFYDRIGKKYGISEASLDIATAGLGAGGLTLALRGAGHILSGIVSKSKELTSEERAAMQLILREEEVNSSIPFTEAEIAMLKEKRGDIFIPNRIVDEHRANLKNAESAFAKNETPQIGGTFSEVKAQIAEMIPQKKARDIIQFVIDRGGIRVADENTPDVKVSDLKNFNKGYQGTLFKNKGVPFDMLREAAVEAGYLPEGATLNDLLDAISETAAGRKVFSSKDQDEVSKMTEFASAERQVDEFDSWRDSVKKVADEKFAGELDDTDITRVAEMVAARPDRFMEGAPEKLDIEDVISDYVERRAIGGELPSAPARAADIEDIKTHAEKIESLQKVDDEIDSDIEADLAAIMSKEGDFDIDGVRMSEIFEDLAEDQNIINAMRSCSI